MNPTQKNSGEKMGAIKEDLLCKTLEYGGKCLEDESLAFQKKFIYFNLDK